MLRIYYRNSILSKLKNLYAIFVFVMEVITLSGNYRPISILNDSRNSLKNHFKAQQSATRTSRCLPVTPRTVSTSSSLNTISWSCRQNARNPNLFTDRRTVCKHVCACSGAAADSPPSRPENCSFTTQLTVRRWKRSLCVQDGRIHCQWLNK